MLQCSQLDASKLIAIGRGRPRHVASERSTPRWIHQHGGALD